MLLAGRSSTQAWQSLAFFFLVILLFPLGLGTHGDELTRIAPGVIWVAVLLAMLLSINRCFSNDYQDGTLESWLLSPYPFAWLVFAKVLSEWLISLAPLLLATPILALLFHLDTHQALILFATLLLGTPTLYAIGAIFSGLTVGFGHSNWLLALLMIPMSIPVFIFSCGICKTAMEHGDTLGQFAVLGILLILALALSPFVTAYALKISLHYGSGND